MQFISAKPLIDKYRSGTFHEAEVGPYFMAQVILMAIVTGFAIGDATPWSIATGFASIVINVIGVLHLKKQNKDTFGNSFLSKYICLGWVITVRMLLLIIPSGVVIFGVASIVGGVDAMDPATAILSIAFEVLFYWWLGTQFAICNQSGSEQDRSVQKDAFSELE